MSDIKHQSAIDAWTKCSTLSEKYFKNKNKLEFLSMSNRAYQITDAHQRQLEQMFQDKEIANAEFVALVKHLPAKEIVAIINAGSVIVGDI